MAHYASPSFWEAYDPLPPEIRSLADKQFALLKQNPQHRSLGLKKVGPYWSVRVGLGHRALGIQIDAGIQWFWIGPHRQYEKLIRS
jgi:hypothetical protein